jgi:hypothetical protein
MYGPGTMSEWEGFERRVISLVLPVSGEQLVPSAAELKPPHGHQTRALYSPILVSLFFFIFPLSIAQLRTLC